MQQIRNSMGILFCNKIIITYLKQYYIGYWVAKKIPLPYT
jgi:hypothetical protein